MLPNFLIIGVQKAGTTSLINYLSQHPDVFVPHDKEIPYFHDDSYFQKGLDYYKKQFDGWKGETMVGLAPVNTFFYAEKAAPRLYEYNPSMKLILILRNPIDRAYSHYWYCRRNALESTSFESAMTRELQLIESGCREEMPCVYYISHGFYYEQLEVYLKYFPLDKFLILFYDELKSNPRAVMQRIYLYLGIEETYINGIGRKHNVASIPRIASLHKLVYQQNPLKRIYKSILPENLQQYAQRTLVSRLLKKNLIPTQYPPMKSKTREMLVEIFKGPNRKLSNLLGRDFSHWA